MTSLPFAKLTDVQPRVKSAECYEQIIRALKADNARLREQFAITIDSERKLIADNNGLRCALHNYMAPPHPYGRSEDGGRGEKRGFEFDPLTGRYAL